MSGEDPGFYGRAVIPLAFLAVLMALELIKIKPKNLLFLLISKWL
jgi:hypothetical protein